MQEHSAALDHQLDAYIEQSEARISRWFEPFASRLIACWARFRRWRDDG
jgi:hypothetical protein